MREQGHFDMTLRICLQIDHYYKQESVKMQENLSLMAYKF